CCRQGLDPIRHGLRTTLTCPIQRVGANEPAHRFPIARVAKERQRFADLSAFDQKLGGARSGLAPVLGGESPLELFQEKLAEERVIVVSDLLAAPPIGEQMSAIQVFEQSRQIGRASWR